MLNGTRLTTTCAECAQRSEPANSFAWAHPMPHSRRDWACPPATSAPGRLGPPLPSSAHRDWAHPPALIRTGAGRAHACHAARTPRRDAAEPSCCGRAGKAESARPTARVRVCAQRMIRSDDGAVRRVGVGSEVTEPRALLQLQRPHATTRDGPGPGPTTAAYSCEARAPVRAYEAAPSDAKPTEREPIHLQL